ncbi:MAG TPA: ABC transporter permease [Solirubrobacterales bacterium]|nr:ABC transporter permease [Solirubrobacterales bacterium]
MAGKGVGASTAAPVRRHPWTRFFLPTYVFLVMAYTLVPIAVMILYTFNKAPNDRLTFAWHGFTTEWYGKLFDVADLTQALMHSLEVAVISSIIATALGTPAAMALARRKFAGRGAIDLTVVTSLTAPTVVVGASLLGFFIALNVSRGIGTILIAHVAFNLAIVIIVVQARLSGLDHSLEEAAQDLGANPWVAFWKVTLPLIAPGIFSAFLLSFALSIDDYIITSFVAGQTLTFPLWVAGAVKVGIPPQVFVMGTLIFVSGVLIAAASLILQRRGERRLAVQAADDDWV